VKPAAYFEGIGKSVSPSVDDPAPHPANLMLVEASQAAIQIRSCACSASWALTVSATPLTFSFRTRRAYSFILPLFDLGLCFAAARLSDSSICFSISFNRRFSPSIIFSFTLPIRTMFLLVWQWVLSLMNANQAKRWGQKIKSLIHTNEHEWKTGIKITGKRGSKCSAGCAVSYVRRYFAGKIVEAGRWWRGQFLSARQSGVGVR